VTCHHFGRIEDLFVALQPLADEHGSTLSIAHEGEPITIKSDERRVRQILLNLLSNAIKFGNGKPIRVVPKRAKAPNGEESVVIEVIDQGMGSPRPTSSGSFKNSNRSIRRSRGRGWVCPFRAASRSAWAVRSPSKSAEGRGNTFRLTLPMGAR
jgi:signal transduction histidine kinase